MNYSKTDYKNKFLQNKNQLELSKTTFGKFNYNNKLKNSFYNGRFNSFSMDIPIQTSTENILTNKILKTINKIRSSKSIKEKVINKKLKNFHTESIKLKIRENNKYKSLFDKIDLSSPNENLFKSPQLKNKERILINLKLKYNKNKIFNHIVEKNINSIYLDESGKLKKERKKKLELLFDKDNKNNKLTNYKSLAGNISKTHLTTSYYPSFGNNKSENKSLSSIHKNINYISNTEINNNKKEIYNNDKDYNYTKIETEKVSLNTDENSNINIKNILLQNTIKTENNNINNFNTLESFITSINYVQPPPFPVEFREQNLINFYSKTRDLRYTKYFLFLKKNKLKNVKETLEYMSILHNIDLLKFIHFYKLFKPYNYYLEKYLIFLKEEINLEHKENQKLKIKKNNLLSEVISDRKKLLQIHMRLKLYLNDKFFLLCVKNSTLNKDFFEEKDKLEFENDLKFFEILKKYINELSEITLNESLLEPKKRVSIVINTSNSRKLSKSYYQNNLKYNYMKKKSIRNNEKFTINFFNSSRNHFKQKPIFENVNEFNDYMKNSRTRIENLLMKDNKIGIEVANLRDYYLIHLEDIKKSKYNKFILNNQFDKLSQELFDAKNYNKKLISYKSNLVKNRKKRIYIKVTKKITEIMNEIYDDFNRKENKLINKNNNFKPLLQLRDLENVIIYLINYKNNQKRNNTQVFNEVIKKIDKNKRLAIIKQKREEDEQKKEKKYQELIEKDMKILNFNNRRINIKYKPFHKKKARKKESIDEEKDSVDISF